MKWSNFDFWWFAVQILHHIYQIFFRKQWCVLSGESMLLIFSTASAPVRSYNSLRGITHSTLFILLWSPYSTSAQCGRTYGAIDESSRNSKAIDKCVVINFRDKNDFLWQNVMMYHDMSWFVMLCHDMPLYVWKNVSSINSYSVLLIVILFYW